MSLLEIYIYCEPPLLGQKLLMACDLLGNYGVHYDVISCTFYPLINRVPGQHRPTLSLALDELDAGLAVENIQPIYTVKRS